MTSCAQQKLPTGEGFAKFCHPKKACVGDGGECVRTLVDVFGIKVTVQSCCDHLAKIRPRCTKIFLLRFVFVWFCGRKEI